MNAVCQVDSDDSSPVLRLSEERPTGFVATAGVIFGSVEEGYPKYLVLQERLLLKLELLLEQVNARGFPAETLTIMSGYRTPWYNETIKNVPYSRHVYGGAADVFVDIGAPDGIMDDLNRDGRSDHADAQTLYAWAHGLLRRPRGRRRRPILPSTARGHRRAPRRSPTGISAQTAATAPTGEPAAAAGPRP